MNALINIHQLAVSVVPITTPIDPMPGLSEATLIGTIQILIFFGILIAASKPLGLYMARVFKNEKTLLSPVFGPVETLLYRSAGVDPEKDQTWKEYAAGVLVFSLVGFIAVYLLQRVQGMLPLNPAGFGAVTPDSSFNTSVSFVTNTNWQGYGGEATMSYLTQMLGLSVQNFVSAASGMAVMAAMIRGFTRRKSEGIGNFWADMTRSILYILLPLSVIVALLLVSQGVVQTFGPYAKAALIDPFTGADGAQVTEQVLALGPAASQVAIKQLGTNGGGFFNVNSAHPFENATAISNLIEMLSIIIISGGLCFTFGRMVGDDRQGRALFVAMLIVLVPLVFATAGAEQAGTPVYSSLGIDDTGGSFHPGGNMEGKEMRFGVFNSALWSNLTTATSNGSVNSMHDSFTPFGGMIPMWFMQLGEVIFGGVGSGLYGMLLFVIVAVFISGLMVGRTPEYLGKKIEAYEMKMASLAILVPCAVVLAGTAVAVVAKGGLATIYNPGMHGFSEVLYAFSSAGNNNGSAFAGLGANTPFYNCALGLAMWFSRFWVIVPVLAIAGSLAAKKQVPAGPGTLPTHGLLFTILLVCTVLLVGALTFVPALALGPIAEHLQMIQ